MGQFITEAAAKDYLKSIYDSAYLDHAGALQESLLTEDISMSESDILGYIRDTYNDATDAITEDAAPQAWQLLRGLAFAILLRRAYMRFDYGGIPEGVTTAADNAVKRLLDIQRGKFKLPDLVQVPRDGMSVSFGSRASFSRSSMRGF